MPNAAPNLELLDEQAAMEFARTFDLKKIGPDFLDNPFPTYHLMRKYDPVHLCPDGSYFLTRYDHVAAIYKERRVSSDKKVEFKPKFGDGPLFVHHTTSLVFNDPPYHTRVRAALVHGLSPRALKAMEPTIIALVDDLLDRAEAKGEMDLIADLAYALPVEVICNMLGVPREERAPLREYSRRILTALEPVISDEQLRQGNEAVEEFAGYLDGLIDERRGKLSDDPADILSSLIRGGADGEMLSQQELIQNCIFLLNAGHETTTNLVGNGVAAIIEDPGQMALLRAQPELIGSAIEEFLRIDSSNQLGNRRVIEDMEIGGVSMPTGTLVTMCIGGANRDPEQFPDPDRLDITRQPNRHLAFGSGIHACAGMALARLEGQVAIGRLIERFPGLRRNGDFVRGGRARFRGFASFPIAW